MCARAHQGPSFLPEQTPPPPQKHSHGRVVALRPRRSTGWLLSETRFSQVSPEREDSGPLPQINIGTCGAGPGWEGSLGEDNLDLSERVSSEEAFVLSLLHLSLKAQTFHCFIFSLYLLFPAQNCSPPFISSSELMTPTLTPDE